MEKARILSENGGFTKAVLCRPKKLFNKFFGGHSMKSIKQKIFLCCILLVGISLLILGTFAGIMTYKTTIETLSKDLLISTELAANRIS